MTPDNPQNTLDRMEALLRLCRRRILLAEAYARLREALDAGLRGLLQIASVFLALRFLAWAFGTPAPGAVSAISLVLIFWLFVFVRAAVKGLRGVSNNPAHAAERLDFSQATHNRIATAIELLRKGDDSPFAKAAISEGSDYLERLQGKKPHVEVGSSSWQHTAYRGVAGVAMLLAGFFLVPKSGTREIPGGAEANAAVRTTSPSDSPVPEDEPEARDSDLTEPRPSELAAMKPEKTGEKEQGKRPEPASESRSEGAAGRHASSESRSSQTASNSRSSASGGGAKSEPGDAEPGSPPKKPRDGKPQVAGKPKPQEESKQGGSINARGSSGAGSMQTAQNEWSSKVKAKSDDNDATPQENEPDEEMDPDKQRSGVQPALKNRSSRVSRQLSLFMGNEPGNQQNRGRGGPSGQKKSRGTATMIMGVPVPGFIRGRMLSGPTKSTQEEVEPTPRAGEYAEATELPQSRPGEDPQERFRAPVSSAASARDYLIQYHTEHDNRRNEVEPKE